MTAPDHRRHRSKISCIDGGIHTWILSSLDPSRASLQRVEHKRIQDGAFTTKANINTDGGTTWTALATNVA